MTRRFAHTGQDMTTRWKLHFIAFLVAIAALVALPYYVRSVQLEIFDGQFWLSLCGFGGIPQVNAPPPAER